MEVFQSHRHVTTFLTSSLSLISREMASEESVASATHRLPTTQFSIISMVHPFVLTPVCDRRSVERKHRGGDVCNKLRSDSSAAT